MSTPKILFEELESRLLLDGTLSIADTTVPEPALGLTGTATLTVILAGRTDANAVTVGYATTDGTATAGVDYTATSGILTFPVGTNAQTISVSILHDAANVGQETFNVVLSTPVNATISDASAVVTIGAEEAAPGLSIDSVTVEEGDSGTTTATFTVTLAEASEDTVTVHYATADGTAKAGSDYTSSSGTLSFAPGDLTKTIDVQVSGDTVYEANETFSVNLTNATNASITTAKGTGTIQNDDAAPIANIDDVSVTRGYVGTKDMTFTVTLSAGSGLGATFAYATHDGSAVAGVDYVAKSGTLSFAAGETSKQITVQIIGSTVREANKTLTLDLSNPTNATIDDGLGVGTIINVAGFSWLTVKNVKITEGDSGTKNAVFLLSVSPASGQSMTVDYATQDGTATAGVDYVETTGTLSLAAGQGTATISVPIIGDIDEEANETFFVVLSNPANVNLRVDTGTATISNDDVSRPVSIGDVTIVEGDSGTTYVTFAVRASGRTDNVTTVHYETVAGTATEGVDYVGASGDLTFAPNETVKTVTVAINGDTDDEAEETFSVVLSAPAGMTIVDGTGTCTIWDDDNMPSVSIDDVTLAEGTDGTTAFVFTVTLSGASDSSLSIDYVTASGTALAGTDFLGKSATLLFAPGETTKTVTVPVIADGLDEGDETFYVDLRNPKAVTIADDRGEGTILDDDGPDLVGYVDTSKQTGPIIPGSKKSGSLKNIQVMVTNVGNTIGSGIITIDLYASADTALGGDTFLGTATVTVKKLKPGKTMKVALKKLLSPVVIPGWYYVLANLDAGNTIDELDEANNVAVSTSQVQWL